MKFILCIAVFGFCFLSPVKKSRKIFDVHLHGQKEPSAQLAELKKKGVYRAAISTSWDLQNSYRNEKGVKLLYGLMFPCPNGKVPYSLQHCFEDGQEWPSVYWVEDLIKEEKIDFLGEMLNQYFGISSSDSLLFPYYALAEKYQLPVGIHTGAAGPGHGSPNFSMEMGNPNLLKGTLEKFPKLKLWIMHGGDQYHNETVSLMKAHPGIYMDISVLCNPDIVSTERFQTIMKIFIDGGLEDRIMFGTDNGDIGKTVDAVEALGVLSNLQKEKIFYKNAEIFFAKKSVE
jgi:predicted TIM-barrel fold metal-dependent hydrolase